VLRFRQGAQCRLFRSVSRQLRFSRHAERIELIYLPPYAPEHNPDEFLNNDLKQAMARRRTPRVKAALKSDLTSYMRSLQRCPAKVRTFFQAPTVQYAA
jgi:hypothetical protein